MLVADLVNILNYPLTPFSPISTFFVVSRSLFWQVSVKLGDTFTSGRVRPCLVGGVIMAVSISGVSSSNGCGISAVELSELKTRVKGVNPYLGAITMFSFTTRFCLECNVKPKNGLDVAGNI